uniref:DENN domain-containing protein 1A-like n=1 Tax=Stegastes partitus TaxID=144197 RepID=A0A3B4YY10_9TELE
QKTIIETLHKEGKTQKYIPEWGWLFTECCTKAYNANKLFSPSLFLCLSCENLLPCSLTVSQVSQNFTFVLTDIESKQRFGFCRLSTGAHTRCYCILSYLPWFEVFYKLLNILADYTVKGQHSFFTVPDARELPSIPENRNLTEYFVAVDVNNMLHLYASMLYERRILICCSKLSTLTACVHGSAAMLYPMHWQHVYIPVLPQHLLDYCCAPMPYLIGVHSSLMEKVRGMALDDVVVLNIDTNTLETPYDDLQSLPNDVVSSLKSRLKKVSTTTGDGVAKAFLKSQAALFGSYRNALQIEPGEPITFNEETFINHRSSAMRQFLQNAIQLQLFKQFIDGRLDLLNAGEGFSDIFEEEISMGEYAGDDKTYHQWLLTVKKGGGAIFNTVKTKANPAMKTVYKLAKDHAKMRIKEVKSRLKQKVCNSTFSVRPTRHYTVFLSEDSSGDEFQYDADSIAGFPDSFLFSVPFEWPQPYRSLKEVELMEGDDPGFGAESHTAPPSPVNEKFSSVNLLGDIFGCQDEPDSQPITLAKSLEDLRNPKDELHAKFTYQRMDLSVSDNSQMLPGLKLSNPYNKMWSRGKDETVLPVGVPTTCEIPPPIQLLVQAEAHSPGRESSSAGTDPLDPSTAGNITIPRPHGRKTPELGTVLAPPMTQLRTKTSGATQSSSAGLTDGDLPPFSLHPHISLNPFAQSLQHTSSQMHYSPVVSANPFNAVYGPPPGSYLNTPPQPQSFSAQTGLYRQHSPGSSTLPPYYGLLQSSFPSSVSPLRPSSASNHAISSLMDSTSVPTTATNILKKPLQTEGDSEKIQDPFGDLLTMANPATPPKKKVEDLRRKWETFD